ncbi:MAG: P-loop NTPase [Acidimicrobiales bacterium]|nr:P-loop NTPase [Acidimicrobiales bacterium]
MDPDEANRGRLSAMLNKAPSFSSVDEVAPRLNGDPVVLVLGPSYAEQSRLETVAQLLSARREVGAVMIAQKLSTDVMRVAMRAGLSDVLTLPVDKAGLAEAVERAAASLTVTPAAMAPSGVEFEADGELARVITVFSPKGGSGKSVIASNLAVSLARRSPKPVVLIDADLQFGDIAVMLKLSPQHTIVDAVSALDRLDAPMLQNLLVQHKESGLMVLPAPLEPAFADQIGAAEIVRIVEVLRTFCSYVVVDTCAYFNDVVLGLIEISDDVLIVAGMDIPNIKNVRIGLQTLKLLNTPSEKLRLILNRSNSQVRLDVKEIERTLGVTADALVPSDVVVPQTVNRGEAVVLKEPKSSVAKALEELADLFLPRQQAKKK